MQKDIERAEKISTQVLHQQIFARIAPVTFLVVAMVAMVFGIVPFKQIFYVGLVLFAVTAVSWWFWVIFNIREYAETNKRTFTTLLAMNDDFVKIREEVGALNREHDNVKNTIRTDNH